ncbi:unnamed protein product [Cuscuta campestris]|uniref:Uncharacterized protein n=1 Tax=Cuscuta campestris TaxID=132261 RepID=A0A484LS75_9ASTE|nr:unnamed protein product [Cuscuta campestris]
MATARKRGRPRKKSRKAKQPNFQTPDLRTKSDSNGVGSGGSSSKMPSREELSGDLECEQVGNKDPKNDAKGKSEGKSYADVVGKPLDEELKLKFIPTVEVKFPDLDLKYWSMAGLSKLGSAIGKPIRRDKTTATRSKLGFARILLEVGMKQDFLEMIQFLDETGRIISQQVEYEWCPITCTYCHKLGHHEEVQEEVLEKEQTKDEDNEGFTEVSKKKAARRIELEVLKEVWEQEGEGRAMYQVVQKLKALKKPLKKLNRDKFADIHNQCDVLREELMETQRQVRAQMEDEGLIMKEKRLLQELHTKIKASCMLKKQIAKQKWIVEGDQNSKIFYAWVKKKRLQNQISAIMDSEGNKVEGTNQVGEVFLEYFNKLLGSELQTDDIKVESMELGSKLSTKKQLELIEPITPLQIKEALFSIPSSKSPGPDGYNSGFFKKQWHVVGELVTKAVADFF